MDIFILSDAMRCWMGGRQGNTTPFQEEDKQRNYSVYTPILFLYSLSVMPLQLNSFLFCVHTFYLVLFYYSSRCCLITTQRPGCIETVKLLGKHILTYTSS